MLACAVSACFSLHVHPPLLHSPLSVSRSSPPLHPHALQPARINRWRQQQQQQRQQTRRTTLIVMREDGEEEEDSDDSAGKLTRPGNRYVNLMQNITAPELIKGFAETAPAEVQQAVRQTVVSLLGNLPAHLYDVNVMSTGQNVASLMYSMQMTGYMFRNAEYRRSLLETLEGSAGGAASPILTSGDGSDPSADLPPVSGKIKVKLSENQETEVEASAYMAELRSEVAQLRGELANVKEDALLSNASAESNGLLSYMQSLGRDNVESLTSSISQDVLEAMRVLIENILSDAGVGGESFMETSGLKLRELLVWQLITGYKLRELEAKEELNRLLDPDGAKSEKAEEGSGEEREE